MGFNAPAGTRGARQPRAGLMMRWVNKMAARRIRRTGKMMGLGFNGLILTTVGAKSGAERTNPVGWFPSTDGSWLIVASAAGGAEPGLVSQHRRASRPGEDRAGRPHDPGDRRPAARNRAGRGMAADHRHRAPLRGLPAQD